MSDSGIPACFHNEGHLFELYQTKMEVSLEKNVKINQQSTSTKTSSTSVGISVKSIKIEGKHDRSKTSTHNNDIEISSKFSFNLSGDGGMACKRCARFVTFPQLQKALPAIQQCINLLESSSLTQMVKEVDEYKVTVVK